VNLKQAIGCHKNQYPLTQMKKIENQMKMEICKMEPEEQNMMR